MLAACVISIVVGGALLARGLVGRRVGDEPRCRRCGYIVHGIESGQCPECGLALGPGAVRIGVRVRRRRALAIGCLLLLIGAAFGVAVGTGWAARTNFYQYLPTGWVVQAAGRGSRDAFSVLQRRVYSGEVKSRLMRDVIETGLAVQGAENTDATTQSWIHLLVYLESRAGLSAEQRERFYGQMFQFSMNVESPMRPGELLRVALALRTRMSRTGEYQFDELMCRVGDCRGEIRVPGVDLSRASWFGTSEHLLEPVEFHVPCVKPGESEVELSFLVGLRPSGAPMVSRRIVLRDRVSVLPSQNSATGAVAGNGAAGT